MSSRTTSSTSSSSGGCIEKKQLTGCDDGDQFDRAFDLVGHFGKGQAWTLVAMLYLPIIPAIQAGIGSFTQATPDFFCNQGNGTYNTEIDERCNTTKKSMCLEGCKTFEYSKEIYQSTLVTEFNLVCADAHVNTHIKSLFFVGFFIGAAVCGFFTDNYGRKKTMLGILAVGCFSDIAIGLAPNLIIYTGFRILAGTCGLMVYITAFIMALEVTGQSWRSAVGIALNGGMYGVGFMVIATYAYYIRDWRNLQFALAATYVPAFLWCLMIPESPRWLLIKGRVEEARNVLKHIACQNGNCDVDLSFLKPIKVKSVDRKYTVVDVFRQSRAMSKVTVILMLLWLSDAWIYYGLTLNSVNLPGSVYQNFFISGAIELPIYFFIPYMMNHPKLGRRLACGALFFLSAVLCLSATIIKENSFCDNDVRSDLVIMRIVLSSLGKMLISGAFAITWNWTSELYPTPIRGTGQGATSSAARVAIITTPLILSIQPYISWGPGIFMSIVGVLAAFLCTRLPETAGRSMMTTFEDAEDCYSQRRAKGNPDQVDL